MTPERPRRPLNLQQRSTLAGEAAAAAASTKKAAYTAARDNAAREREAQRHRLEDH